MRMEVLGNYPHWPQLLYSKTVQRNIKIPVTKAYVPKKKAKAHHGNVGDHTPQQLIAAEVLD